ncbi:hypothetical protein CAP35_09120 [Chitinophagaceae bacterium IBVUCB1]|nr:hypothetical protein CAP35_09120 [Chitinophagaceae bacterium IBVUCB1]
MKHILVVFVALVSLAGIKAYAQLSHPDWYILEKGATVSIIKPGVNDLTYYLATSGNKPIDRAAVDSMNMRVRFAAGNVVLIYAKEGDSYIAQDMEGRNLVIKGNVTKAIHNNGCTVGYLKAKATSGSVSINKASFVWIKEKKAGGAEVVVQGPDKVDITVPASQLYDINATTLEMLPSAAQKIVE